MQHSLGLSLLLVAFVFVTVFFWNRIFVSVYPGEAAVVWRRFGGGTSEAELYSEGLHIFAPWDKVYRYDIRKQGIPVSLHPLCANGLQIEVSATVRFRPHRHRLALVHKWYGPKYAQVLVIPEVESAVQEVVGQYLPEQIYSLRRRDLENRMLELAGARIGPEDIELLDIAITSINLPTRIQEAIQAKLEEDQKVQQLDFRLQRERKEALRKEIEARGVATFNQTIRAGLDEQTLRWKSIEAALELSKSPNAKVIIMGGKNGLPLVLGGVADGK